MTTATSLEVRTAIAEFVIWMNEASKRHPFASNNFEVDGGRKYIRIVAAYNGSNRHVHCFVDAQTGGVYKPATFQKPALNGERYNLLDPASLERLHELWDPHGGYLYKK